MSKSSFQVGKSYKVLHLSDFFETVEIASITSDIATLTDGRQAKILSGVAPDGKDEEVLRLDEQGAYAAGGVVRVCQLVSEAA